MKCVSFGNRLPNGFEEQFPFSKLVPYSIQIKKFDIEDIVPPHYGPTLEILVCDDLKGTIRIDSKQYSLSGQHIFVIPPRVVHATDIPACSGTQYVLKLSFEDLLPYLDAGNYLSLCGCDVSELSYSCPDFLPVATIVFQLIDNDGDLSRCLISILQLLQILAHHTDDGRDDGAKFKSSSLRELINWTQSNYMHRISIDDAAAFTGYSKYHFCNRFRCLTGMTYINYVNSVRIAQACRLLQSGLSAKEVCRAIGFDNLSYFIQLFRRSQHLTPSQYSRQYRDMSLKSENHTR